MTEVTLKLSLNMADDGNDKNYFLYNLLMSDRQVSKLCKAFSNDL